MHIPWTYVDRLKDRTLLLEGGWLGDAMVLGKLPRPGGPIAFAVCVGGGCLDIFTLLYLFISHSPSYLGDSPIQNEISSQRAVNPKTTN